MSGRIYILYKYLTCPLNIEYLLLIKQFELMKYRGIFAFNELSLVGELRCVHNNSQFLSEPEIHQAVSWSSPVLIRLVSA